MRNEQHDDERPEALADRAHMVRSEEELRAGTVAFEAGRVRVGKRAEYERVDQTVPRTVERPEFDRVPAADGDSGEVEVLPDGSLSIPLFEERIVVEKRLFVRERVIVRKVAVTVEEVVTADLRKERIAIDADPEVQDRIRPGPARP
jgi:uncharacterized protein (TIGR02271 family)